MLIQLSDNFKDDLENPEFKKHKKSRDRYVKVYEGEVKLQMKFELGLSHDNMKHEYSIVKYLWLHKLIKFAETGH